MIKAGFYQDDLKVYYHKKLESKTDRKPRKSKNTYTDIYCNFIFAFSSPVYAIVNEQKITLDANSLLVIRPHSKYRIIDNKKNNEELMIISFFPQLFSDVEGDLDFLRVFYNANERPVYTSKDLNGTQIIGLFQSMKTLLFKHFGRIHVLGHLTSIISELCLICDKENPVDIQATDNVSVKIIDYIERHYFEKITINTIQKKYFVSATTINTIVRKSVDCSFKQYITSLRLDDAKQMIISGVSPAKVYSKIGFSDYSSFYRAYKKHFGITPSEEASNKTSWPLTQ